MKKIAQLKMLVLSIFTVLTIFFLPLGSIAQEKASSKNLWQPYYITPRTSVQHLDLSGKWDLLQKDSEISAINELVNAWQYKINVPNSIHWALFEAGVLPHPYYHLNSEKYNFIDEKVWYYRKKFDTPLSAYRNLVYLVFDGIDYYARVWLNGEYLGHHEGMFGGPVVEVSELLRTDKANELIVEVKAANYGIKDTWTYRDNKGRAIRPWVFGYAKKFMPLGMWQGVRLEIVPKNHIERPFLKTNKISPNEAELDLELEVFVESQSLDFQLNEWHNKIIRSFRNVRESEKVTDKIFLKIVMIEKDTELTAFEKKVALDLFKGRNWIRDKIYLKNPKLWWPNGMGDATCYRVKLYLMKDNDILDTIEFIYGIKTLHMLPSAGPKTNDRWLNWQFEINGKKFFVKGINWMPADILMHLPLEQYKWWLDMAKNAGVQLLRVWGGGLIEPEYLYQCCNERGIMVWQDFPMGNADHDTWPQDVWQAQAMMNVFRLRNHPSLALYCGGNEFNPYSLGNSMIIGILEGIITDFDNTRPFLRTSPDRGSIHTYPDMDPTWYQYEYPLVPFIAETGIHNFADAKTLREYIDNVEFEKPITKIFDPSFKERYPDFCHHFTEYNSSRIPRMLSRASQIIDISAPYIDELAEATQIGAGEFYQILSEITQANYPVTTGLMPWVFKRPWTLVAIQTIDATGHPTAPYYFIKRTYEPTHVMVQLPQLLWAKGEKIPIVAKVLHAPDKALSNLTLKVEVLDDRFQSQWQKMEIVTVEAGPSVTTVDLGKFSIPEKFVDNFFFIIAEISDSAGKLISHATYWPRCLKIMENVEFRTKYRAEPQPAMTFDKGPWLKNQVAKNKTKLDLKILSAEHISKDRSIIKIRIRNSGKKAAFPVRLEINGVKRAFFADDNYFWLAAGEERDLIINALWREKLINQKVTISIESWNAKSVEIPISF